MIQPHHRTAAAATLARSSDVQLTHHGGSTGPARSRSSDVVRCRALLKLRPTAVTMESRRTPGRDRTFALFPDLAPLQKLYYHGRQRRYRVRFESHRVNVQVKGLVLVIRDRC